MKLFLCRRTLQHFLALSLVGVLASCSPSRDEQVKEIRFLHNQSRVEETIPRLMSLMQEHPDDPEVNRLYGTALLHSANALEALWPLRKAAVDPEASVEDYLLAANALEAGGAANEAFEFVREVVAIERDNSEGLRLYTVLADDLGHWDEVLEGSERLIEINPAAQPMIYTKRANALASLKRFSEAYEVLDQASRVFEPYENGAQLRTRFCLEGAKIAIKAANLGDEELSAVEQAKVAAAGGDLRESDHDEAGLNEENVQIAEDKWRKCLEQFPASPEIVFGAISFFDDQQQRAESEVILRRLLTSRPHDLSIRSHLADRLAQEKRFQEAEEIFREITEVDRLRAAAWFQFAHYFRDREDYAAATEAFETGVLALNEAQVESLESFVFAQYAEDCIQSEQFEKAEEAIKLIDRPEYISLLRGRMALAQGDPEKAIAELNSGLRLYQGNSAARYLLGQAAEQLGDVDRAIEEYRDSFRTGVTNSDSAFALARIYEAEGNFQKMMHILNVRSGRALEDPRTNQELARASSLLGWFDVARSAIDRLAAAPGQDEEVALATAQVELLENGPEASVEAILNLDLDPMQPDSHKVFAALLQALIRAERYDEAMERVEAARLAHPDFAPYHRLYAMVLRASGTGDEEGRRIALERSVELDPENPRSLRALAEWNAASGNLERAIELYDRSALVDSETPEVGRWAAIQTLIDAGDDSLVDARLEELVATNATHSAAASLLARRLLEADGDLDRADALAKRAVRFRGNARALETAGLIALKLEQSNRSLWLLKKAAQMRPKSRSIRYQLARAQIAAGHSAGARKSLEFSLSGRDFPDADAAREALALLDSKDSNDE